MITTTRARALSSLLRQLEEAADTRAAAEEALTPFLLELVPGVRAVRQADVAFEGILAEAYSVAFSTTGDERGQLLEAIAGAVKRHGRMRYECESGGVADYTASRLARLKADGRINHEE